MNFQSLSDLFYLVPLGGIVIALYLLKMKRRDVMVPATFLWPARTEEVRANSLFQRLRFSWLLVLQLIALALLVSAFARPQAVQTGLAGETTVLIIDSGASMQATDVKPSRFEEAKRLALEAIHSEQPSDRMAMIEAGPSPRVVFPLSSDPLKQERAMDSLRPTDAEVDVAPALRLASALVGSMSGARIVLLSDGVFQPVTNFSVGKASVVYKAIGKSGDNLAISALGLAETTNGRELYCGVRSYSSKPFHGELAIYADGKLLDARKFEIAPKGSYGATVPAPPSSKVFEAKLDAPDDLKSDNYAVCLADPGASLRVLLVSPGDLFVERALALDPRVTLDKSPSLPAGVSGKYDIVVFDGVREQPVAAPGVLTLGEAGAGSPVTVVGKTKGPRFLSSEPVALMKGVNLRGTFIDAGQKVAPKASGQVVAESSDGPLIVMSDSKGKRQVYVAFDPLQSDFPLQVAFPILIANSLDFLGGNGSANLLAVKAGVPFSITGSSTATLTAPDGTKSKLEPANGSIIVRDVKRVGVYQLSSAGKSKTIYSTLTSERASNIEPAVKVTLGGGTVKTINNPARFADFWRPLAVACLLVLAVEWAVFMRRS